MIPSIGSLNALLRHAPSLAPQYFSVSSVTGAMPIASTGSSSSARSPDRSPPAITSSATALTIPATNATGNAPMRNNRMINPTGSGSWRSRE